MNSSLILLCYKDAINLQLTPKFRSCHWLFIELDIIETLALFVGPKVPNRYRS